MNIKQELILNYYDFEICMQKIDNKEKKTFIFGLKQKRAEEK